MTVPAVGVGVPATVAVIVNTDPFAAGIVGLTASVVVVAICAPATAKDITKNNATPRAVSGFVRRTALRRAFSFLTPSNDSSASPEVCGDPIAPERIEDWRMDCARTVLAAATRDQSGSAIVLADGPWQERSGDEALLKTFINTGISKPFD